MPSESQPEMFPGVAEAPVNGACAWCGGGPTRPYEVEPAIVGTDKRTGIKVPKRRAIVAPACAACYERLDAQNQRLKDMPQPKSKKKRGYVIQ